MSDYHEILEALRIIQEANSAKERVPREIETISGLMIIRNVLQRLCA